MQFAVAAVGTTRVGLLEIGALTRLQLHRPVFRPASIRRPRGRRGGPHRFRLRRESISLFDRHFAGLILSPIGLSAPRNPERQLAVMKSELSRPTRARPEKAP